MLKKLALQPSKYWLICSVFCFALLLSACSSSMLTEGSFPPVRDAHLMTIPASQTETTADLEATYGGTIIMRNDTHAVLSLNINDKAITTSLLGLTELNLKSFEAGASAYINGRSTAWAGGRSTAWAGGRSTAWAGGRSTAWAGGEFVWMPENTQVWQQINLEAGHSLAENLGLDVKVAVIDTGIDLEHPALVEALAPQDEWWDFYDDDAYPQEEGSLGQGGYGHGTNVAGIVRQIAPRATILPLRVLGPDGGGYTSDIVKAIDYAINHGADVINLSLGSGSYSLSIDLAITKAHALGVLVVSSTGNEDTTKITHPAAGSRNLLNGLSQLSVTSVDAFDQKSDFANYGYSVEVAAPGENIYGPAPEMMMTAWSGTSMAAPIVSGMLALALGEYPYYVPADLAEKIKTYSRDLYTQASNESYQDMLGQGRVDVEAFMTAVIQAGE